MPDRIGPFTFVRLEGGVPRAQESWELSARAGVGGHALWATGARGEPFTLVSQAVAHTYPVGKVLLQQYVRLVTQPAVSIFKGTIEQAQRYKVLRVVPEGPGVKAVIRAHVGGDGTTYEALVIARWTLLPIDPTVLAP